MDHESCMRSFEHAAELAGGYDALAVLLRLDVHQVISWSHGHGLPDTTTYLFVLDYIIEETRKLSRSVMAYAIAEQAVSKARNASRWH